MCPPLQSVHFDGKAYLVSVAPGEAGRKKFLADIRRMLNLRPEQEFDVTFECRLPSVVATGGGGSCAQCLPTLGGCVRPGVCCLCCGKLLGPLWQR